MGHGEGGVEIEFSACAHSVDHRGVDRSWAVGVHAHAERRVLRGNAFGLSDHAVLGRRGRGAAIAVDQAASDPADSGDVGQRHRWTSSTPTVVRNPSRLVWMDQSRSASASGA